LDALEVDGGHFEGEAGERSEVLAWLVSLGSLWGHDSGYSEGWKSRLRQGLNREKPYMLFHPLSPCTTISGV
jgi:hypothetical protein